MVASARWWGHSKLRRAMKPWGMVGVRRNCQGGKASSNEPLRTNLISGKHRRRWGEKGEEVPGSLNLGLFEEGV